MIGGEEATGEKQHVLPWCRGCPAGNQAPQSCSLIPPWWDGGEIGTKLAIAEC